jgi:deazaflavin-dependent oxidoreductase (nitroreductase family)
MGEATASAEDGSLWLRSPPRPWPAADSAPGGARVAAALAAGTGFSSVLAVEGNAAAPALLETTGRRTGRPVRTPVCHGLDGEVFWLIAQRGHRADWVKNIQADPRVRVKVRTGSGVVWRAGTAHILDEDDPRERQRRIGRQGLMRRLCVCASAAVAMDPLMVRVDLDGQLSSPWATQPDEVWSGLPQPDSAGHDGGRVGELVRVLAGVVVAGDDVAGGCGAEKPPRPDTGGFRQAGGRA